MTKYIDSRHTPFMRRLALIIILALALAGCARSEGDQPTQPISSAGVSSGASAATGEVLPASAPPLSEYFGYDYSDADASAQYLLERQREAGRIVADCMRRQGFLYTPPPEDSSLVGMRPATEEAFFSEEWVAVYGFGVSTLRWSQQEVGPDLVGHDGPSSTSLADAYGVNDDYVNSLSETEREAWYQALDGPKGGFDLDQSGEPRAHGCNGEGWDQAYGQINELFEVLGDELDTMYDRLLADPRVVEFHRGVNECVAQAGFQWDNIQGAVQHFEPELQDIGVALGRLIYAADLDTMTTEEVEAAISETSELSAADRAKLAVVQANELELAAAVVGCGGGELNDVAAVSNIQAEYERTFADQHGAVLRSLAMEQ